MVMRMTPFIATPVGAALRDTIFIDCSDLSVYGLEEDFLILFL